MRRNVIKKWWLTALVYIAVFSCVLPGTSAHLGKEIHSIFSTVDEEESQIIGYVRGEVLVKFEDGVDPLTALREINLGAQSIERLHSIKPLVDKLRDDYRLKKDEDGWYWFSGKQYESIEDIPDIELFKEVYREMGPQERGLYRVYKVNLPEEISVREAVDSLNSSAKVEYAEPNYVIRDF